MIDDFRYIFETLGPWVGAAFIVFLVCAWLIVQIWGSISTERRKKLEFEDSREKARAELVKMKLEIESARQRSDAEESSSTLKIVERLVIIQEENSRQRGELYEVIKALNAKTENFGNWMALASESSEAHQAFVRGAVTAAEQRSAELRGIVSPLPSRLDVLLEATIAAKVAAQKAEVGISTVSGGVTGAIRRLTAIETLLNTIEQSVSAVKTSLIQAQDGKSSEEIEREEISRLVDSIIELKQRPDEPEPEPDPTTPASAPDPEKAEESPGDDKPDQEKQAA